MAKSHDGMSAAVSSDNEGASPGQGFKLTVVLTRPELVFIYGMGAGQLNRPGGHQAAGILKSYHALANHAAESCPIAVADSACRMWRQAAEKSVIADNK